MDQLVSAVEIILVNLVLSGDNAVVIALATRKLPPQHRRKAVFWGGVVAILARIAFTVPMAYLVMIPGLRLIGGGALALIACKLLVDDGGNDTEEHAAENAWAAIRTICIADIVMSLDNMLAVAGASRGDPFLLTTGLIVSMVMIMTCSALIARIMNRFDWVAYVGAGVLAFAAAELMNEDLAACFHGEWLAAFRQSLPAFEFPVASWALYATVLGACLTSRRWWPGESRATTLGESLSREIEQLCEQPELAALSLHISEGTLEGSTTHTTGPFYRRLLHVEQPAELT